MDNVFIKRIVPLIVLFAIMISSIYIGKFFKISIGTYLGYILWFIGLTILYFLLPKQRSSLFSNSSD